MPLRCNVNRHAGSDRPAIGDDRRRRTRGKLLLHIVELLQDSRLDRGYFDRATAEAVPGIVEADSVDMEGVTQSRKPVRFMSQILITSIEEEHQRGIRLVGAIEPSAQLRSFFRLKLQGHSACSFITPFMWSRWLWRLEDIFCVQRIADC